MQTIQAAIVAAITQAVALVVAFGVINNTTAGVIISASAAVVNAAFVVGQAIENHGKSTAPPAPAPAAAKK